MIIVLEGPDGSGKSTLSLQLEKDLGATLHRSPMLPSQEVFDFVTEEQEYHAERKELHIHDRVTWISELIYSRALDRPVRLNLNKFNHYLDLPQIVVYCAPTGINKMNIDVGFKAHKSKDHLDAVMRNHTKIINMYEGFMGSNSVKFTGYIRYNWKHKGAYRELLDYIRGITCVV